MTNFELHRRKTFWVDESLAYMLAKTDLDVGGREMRMPFPSFAFVFTDRFTLSLAERTLSLERNCPAAGQFLKAATVYFFEAMEEPDRVLHVGFALDSLGADPPHLVRQSIPLPDDEPVRRFLDGLAPRRIESPEIADSHPFRGLLHLVFNAVLYATSAGVRPEARPAPERKKGPKYPALVFSSESVFFLPGTIEISRVRQMQELERVSSGRSLLTRFMVRGHWRRPAASWKDQSMRWIQPYWKGTDMAAVIERTYKLKP